MSKGGTVDRGYGKTHRQIRDAWAPIVAAGQATCMEVVCINPGGRAIEPGSEWHLAHLPDRSGYRGPAHPACNLSEAGKRGNKLRRGRPRRKAVRRWKPTRDW